MYKQGRKQLNTAFHISLKLLFLWGKKTQTTPFPLPQVPNNPKQSSFLSVKQLELPLRSVGDSSA